MSATTTGRQQRMEHLQQANATRAARADLRMRLKTGGGGARDRAAVLIMDPPTFLATLSAPEFLAYLPRMSEDGSERLVARALGKMRSSARVHAGLGELTDRERSAIVEALRAR